MDSASIANILGEWDGYRTGTIGRRKVERPDAGGCDGAGGPPREELWIELLPLPGISRRCSGCGRFCTSIHDVEERWVRDLPVFECQTHLLVHRVRVKCPTCGPKLEELSWLAAYARVTARLAESVARLCKFASIRHAADYLS